MKVIIAGSRSVVTLGHAIMAVELAGLHGKITEVVSCDNENSACLYAKRFGIKLNVFQPNFEAWPTFANQISHGCAACYADALVAITGPFDTVTPDILSQMFKLNKPVHAFFMNELNNGTV